MIVSWMSENDSLIKPIDLTVTPLTKLGELGSKPVSNCVEKFKKRSSD